MNKILIFSFISLGFTTAFPISSYAEINKNPDLTITWFEVTQTTNNEISFMKVRVCNVGGYVDDKNATISVSLRDSKKSWFNLNFTRSIQLKNKSCSIFLITAEEIASKDSVKLRIKNWFARVNSTLDWNSKNNSKTITKLKMTNSWWTWTQEKVWLKNNDSTVHTKSTWESYYSVTNTWFITTWSASWPNKFWEYTLKEVDTSMWFGSNQAFWIEYIKGNNLIWLLLGRLSESEIKEIKSKYPNSFVYNWNTYYYFIEGKKIYSVGFRDNKVNAVMFIWNSTLIDAQWDFKTFIDWVLQNI